MYYKISSITLNTGKKTNNIGDLNISCPNEEKEKLMGKLFIVVEVDSKKGYGLKIENFLINNINSHYYQNDNVILRKKLKNIKVENVLQESLSRTNKDFIQFLREEKIKISPYAINITVGVLYKDILHISSVGKNKNLIIYKKQTGAEEYKIINIEQEQEGKIQTVSLLKLFSDISSGRIPKESYYFMANEALSEFLSTRQIIEILTKLPPVSAANHIENILSKINIQNSFLGIIIQNTTRAPSVEEQKEEVERKKTFNIELAQKETEKILQPSGVINFQIISSNINKLFNKIGKLLPAKNVSNIMKEAKLFKDNSLKEKIFFQERESSFSIIKLAKGLKAIIFQTFIITINILKIITNKDSLINLFKKIKSSTITLINSIKNLNIINKIALVIIPITITGFFFTTYFLSIQNKKNEKQEDISGIILKIEETQVKIEAKLLYKDEENAIKLLNENKEKLKELNNIIEENKQSDKTEIYTKLKTKQENQSEKIQHIVKIDNINKIFDFKKINENAKTETLLINKNYVYASDKTNSSVYQFEQQSKFSTNINNEKIKIKNFLSPTIHNDDIFYFNNGTIISLNSQTRELNESKINLPTNDKIISMTTFNNWLYLLDQNNQIHKYTRYGDEFKNRRVWIKEEVDFSNTIDFAIDGNVYVLKDNGSVEVYSQGKKQKFALDDLINKIENPNKILISGKMQEGLIYILEKKKSRLLVFEKNGKFVKQYKNDYFINSDDIFIDENKNILYILNDNILYSYSMKK